MTTLVKAKGLNTDEYDLFKHHAKRELPFLVNTRYHKQKYAYGSIDILPKAPRGNKDHSYRWTIEEFKMVLLFLKRHDMIHATSGMIDDVQPKDTFSKLDMQYLIWGKGFYYVEKVLV